MKIAKARGPDDFHTCFGPLIAEHWALAFPAECAELQQSGQLATEADRKADQAAEYISDALDRGEPFELAAAVASVFWNRPPNAGPLAMPQVDPPAAAAETQESSTPDPPSQGPWRPKGWLQ